MKKIILVLLICSGSTGLNAQYKKAGGVFGGSGVSQTLNFGVSTQIAPNYYSKPPISFHFTSGADKEESRWFQTATIRVQLPADFAVKTKVHSNYTDKTQDVVLKAKTKVIGYVDYDWGLYFNKAAEEVKLRPFAAFGFGFHVGGFKDDSDNSQQLLNDTQSEVIYADLTDESGFGGNVKAGLGLVWLFTEKIGVKADALYHFVPNFSKLSGEEFTTYGAVNSGVVINLRLHIKLPPKK
jgi:hypothetical protein